VAPASPLRASCENATTILLEPSRSRVRAGYTTDDAVSRGRHSAQCRRTWPRRREWRPLRRDHPRLRPGSVHGEVATIRYSGGGGCGTSDAAAFEIASWSKPAGKRTAADLPSSRHGTAIPI